MKTTGRAASFYGAISPLRAAAFAGAILIALAPACFAAPDSEVPAANTQALTLPELQERVRESEAIPVSKKFELQNELDALLEQMRNAHEHGKSHLAALRQPYDRLLSKIQSMLTRDPQLANEVAASREAIWIALDDPAKSAGL